LGYQAAYEPSLLCEECEEERLSPTEKALKQALIKRDTDTVQSPAAVVVYECGATEEIAGPDENSSSAPPQQRSPPTAPVRCPRCLDAPIKTTFDLEHDDIDDPRHTSE